VSVIVYFVSQGQTHSATDWILQLVNLWKKYVEGNERVDVTKIILLSTFAVNMSSS
jgi:hypothetical protein